MELFSRFGKFLKIKNKEPKYKVKENYEVFRSFKKYSNEEADSIL